MALSPINPQGSADAMMLIATGGTFDKIYDPLKGELTLTASHVQDILQRVRCTQPVNVQVLQLLDSLDMQAEHRQEILRTVQQSDGRRVVITHGTDTMVQTAEVLGEAGLEKTIVLTGAMVPYSVSGSDALFNLGCAVAAVQTLPPGVYIAMNGRLFDWDNVQKDTQRGLFETLLD